MGCSRLGWAVVLAVVAMASGPGIARADPVPGFDLDPVALAARMHECLAFTSPSTGDIATIYTQPRVDDWSGCASAL